MVGFYEPGDEHSVSAKGGEFLGYLKDCVLHVVGSASVSCFLQF